MFSDSWHGEGGPFFNITQYNAFQSDNSRVPQMPKKCVREIIGLPALSCSKFPWEETLMENWLWKIFCLRADMLPK